MRTEHSDSDDQRDHAPLTRTPGSTRKTRKSGLRLSALALSDVDPENAAAYRQNAAAAIARIDDMIREIEVALTKVEAGPMPSITTVFSISNTASRCRHALRCPRAKPSRRAPHGSRRSGSGFGRRIDLRLYRTSVQHRPCRDRDRRAPRAYRNARPIGIDARPRARILRQPHRSDRSGHGRLPGQELTPRACLKGLLQHRQIISRVASRGLVALRWSVSASAAIAGNSLPPTPIL